MDHQHHHDDEYPHDTLVQTLTTPHRHSSTLMSSSRKQQSPTSVTATAQFDVAAAASSCLKISIDPVSEDDHHDPITTCTSTTKDLPLLEDASDSQESDVEREFRSLLECALWQRVGGSSRASRTSKLVDGIWNRRWDRVQDRLRSMRHRHEVGEETELPCFTHCRGLPLHLACAMRPLPPLAVVKLLVQVFPHAAQIPESTWGMLPLHLLADLRFQRRTGGPKQPQHPPQQQRHGTSKTTQQHVEVVEETEEEDDDEISTDSSDLSTVSEADAEDDDEVDEKRQHGKSMNTTTTTGDADRLETQTLEHDCSPAVHHGKVLEVVLGAFPDAVKARETMSGMLPLHIAACTGYSQNGLVSETSFMVLELLTKHAPDTKWIKDDWGHSAVVIAWKETVFHCALCCGAAERSNRCPHVWSLPSRFINPLFKSEKRDAVAVRASQGAAATGSHPSKESSSDKRSFPLFINIPADIAISIASTSSSWNSRSHKSTPKRASYDEALLNALFGEHDLVVNDISNHSSNPHQDHEPAAEQDEHHGRSLLVGEQLPKDGEPASSRGGRTASRSERTLSRSERTASRGEHSASRGDLTPSQGELTPSPAGEPNSSRDSSSHNPTHADHHHPMMDVVSHVSTLKKHDENASLVKSRNGGGTIINMDDLEVLKRCDMEERLKQHHHKQHQQKAFDPIGKDVCVDTRFGPFGERFGVDAKSLLTIRIHVSHLKAGKGKPKIGALVKAPNPYVELAVVAKGAKTLVYQSHPLTHRSEATWEAQQISLGLGIKTMYKQAACLFTVYHCRRKGGTPLLIGTYYCAFKDLPTTPVAICRSGKPKGLLCINSFSLEEIPKPCDRVRL